ncbi:MAG: hypothetical protein ACO22R_06095 [Chitinophagaceae bacterium]
MGLDMYAWRVKQENAKGDFEIVKTNDNECITEELFYWRKHHDLHGWMERLYRAKGGDMPSFNCVPVRLYDFDLDNLLIDVVNNNLPTTTGFFFGNNEPDEESMYNDLQFIVKAKQAIREGDAVYYDSWW